MNEYEMMTVFHPRLNADETNAAIAALEEQVAANGGEMLSTDTWGRRRLAYPIDGVVDGTYVLYTFRMPAEGTSELERWIRLSETTLRHLLIRGIIPFEGDRHGREDRYGRDDRDEDDRDSEDERESAAPAPTPAAVADTTAGTPSTEASADREADQEADGEAEDGADADSVDSPDSVDSADSVDSVDSVED